MKHFSHPHSLKLSESPKKEDDEEIMCSGCVLQLSSTDHAYTCTKRNCDFVLHKSCFELPKIVEHKSHPMHSLTLLSEPPRFSFYYDCNACDDLINSFSYKCDECDSFRLHVKCAFLPESVACKAHSHALEMRYYTPEEGRYSCIVSCDVCDGSMREGYWSYFCKECDFGTHLDCAFSAEAVSEKEEEENEEAEEEWEVENENEDEYKEKEVENEDEDEVEEENDNEGEVEEENEDDGLSEQRKLQMATLKAMDQMATLNFQLQMAEMNARFIRNL